ncbi:MAG: LacI family DNA-binding transcriptional regulator [Candidatus Anaerobiospirillum pullicola]|uniref:LacI family DNA-binding transcriptional regulator n=1 Tax=Candidatus Anaerobiospirillum pullicola TaxID=2838451 RepID=A0A948TFU1_9GAMM|nr:LacI family DNA-binding transcriptional regulator [Candidatus Anaerobiospirillum pullicola]
MKVTVKSLAQAAGVSRGTVDRVLHNRGAVKEDVAKRVRMLAKELGYVPNRAGRALAAYKTPIKIGALMPSVGNAFYQEIMEGINAAQNEFLDLGLEVVLREVEGFDEKVHLDSIDYLLEQGCKGLCLATVNTDLVRDRINELHDRGMPVVLLNTDIENTRRLCYVGSDYLTAGATCAGMLALTRQDKLHILIVTGSRLILGHNLRIKGFEEELKRQQIDYEIVDIVESFDSDIRSQKVTFQMLQEHPDINCVYIAGAAVQGVGAALIANGNKDIFAIGFDELYSTKQLVTAGIIKFVVCQQPQRQGYHAIKRAYQAVAGQLGTEVPDFITDTIIKIRANLDMS